MIRIRREQMSVLQEDLDREFHRRAARYIRLRYESLLPDIRDESLAEMVAAGIARGRSHGITSEKTLIAFLDLMFSVAPNFDDVPAIRARLREPSQTQEQRLQSVIENTLYTEWKQACRNYDPAAWGMPYDDDPFVFEVRGSVMDL